MFGQYTKEESDSLIDSIGRKVLYCNDCHTADFVGEEIEEHDGKQHCPYCGDRLSMRSEDRISHNTLDKPIGDRFSKRTWVVRIMDTPWGKLRFAFSTHMNQCYNAYFMPILLDTGKRDQRGNAILHIGDPIPTAFDTAWYYPQTNAAMIKELINDDFSVDAVYAAWKKLDGEKVGLAVFSSFVDRLKALVDDVHATINPQREAIV